MISEEQKLQIEQYLISKKLPLDILLEVKDHMILQIEDCMINEKISFEEAFLKVEYSWKDNFSLTTYWMFYGREKLPKIAKNIMKQKFSAILIKSFALAVLFFSLSFLWVALSVNVDSYKIFFIICNSLLVLIPLVVYFGNLKYKDYFKKNFKYKGQIHYTLYQQNLALFIICFFGVNQIIIEGGEQVYNFFESKHNLSILSLALTSVYRFFIYVFSIFSIFNFFEHKKTIKKLFPFYPH